MDNEYNVQYLRIHNNVMLLIQRTKYLLMHSPMNNDLKVKNLEFLQLFDKFGKDLDNRYSDKKPLNDLDEKVKSFL